MEGFRGIPPDNTVLIDLFGPPRDYNNLNEPRPFTNEPGTIIGFTTTFLVRSIKIQTQLPTLT